MPELNLDGLVGPSHNYAGLSIGNVAATRHAGEPSSPRRAALQVLAKMRLMVGLGIPQGILLPHPRPNIPLLRGAGFCGEPEKLLRDAVEQDHGLFVAAMSASSMWAANAATVSPAPDTGDGRTHLTVANLVTMPHRAMEWPCTLAHLRLVFANRQYFAVHPPVLPTFGDEGAANHMRLAPSHDREGVEVFVYGVDRGGRFPARQHARASAAVARLHGVRDPIFTVQADEAIQAGAFHNDVLAVANANILMAHEKAYEGRDALIESLYRRVAEFTLVEAAEAEVPLADAINSYLFNAMLVTVADGMALIVPAEVRETPTAWKWVRKIMDDPANPIRRLHVLDVRESMRNGGGPACLRLRVPLSDAEFAAVDQRFIMDDGKLDRLERLVQTYWPERIDPADLASPDLWQQCRNAYAGLLKELEIEPEELGP